MCGSGASSEGLDDRDHEHEFVSCSAAASPFVGKAGALEKLPARRVSAVGVDDVIEWQHPHHAERSAASLRLAEAGAFSTTLTRLLYDAAIVLPREVLLLET